MPLTLQKFGTQWDIADPSPYCVKVENFLRANNIPFDTRNFDLKTTFTMPLGKKIPYIILEDGETMGDSTLIIERLSRDRNIDMDKGLTKEQRATSKAFCTMLDEGLYWPVIYSRWQDENGWKVIKPLFFSGNPAFLANIAASYIRMKTIRTIYAQGTGQRNQEEVYMIGASMLKSLSDFLGQNQWFFGQNKPGLMDIWTHAFVINIIRPPIENSLKDNTLRLTNLCRHAENFQKLFYSDKKANENTPKHLRKKAA
ncbi:MAG: glutathione S-transferase family protein [Alphaproteobacteria bacterium]|nr:glutathione S-transferase family protein [Alphaproteobacteria bacterium]